MDREVAVRGSGSLETGRILFKVNSSYIICGRSSSGKTTFIYNMLRCIDELVEKDGRKIEVLYCYSSWQPLFDRLSEDVPNITFHQDLPDEETIEKVTDPVTKHLFLVVDDLMRQVVSSDLIADFFTVKAHHRGTSVLYVSHNLFQQGKYSRAITLNASYFVLFQNPRGADQIQTLSKQIFPGRRNALVDAYRKAMSAQKYGYLFIDMTANVPEELRLRTQIFPDQATKFYCFS